MSLAHGPCDRLHERTGIYRLGHMVIEPGGQVDLAIPDFRIGCQGMTGTILCAAGSRRIRFNAPTPSRTGICMSMRIRSNALVV